MRVMLFYSIKQKCWSFPPVYNGTVTGGKSLFLVTRSEYNGDSVLILFIIFERENQRAVKHAIFYHAARQHLFIYLLTYMREETYDKCPTQYHSIYVFKQDFFKHHLGTNIIVSLFYNFTFDTVLKQPGCYDARIRLHKVFVFQSGQGARLGSHSAVGSWCFLVRRLASLRVLTPTNHRSRSSGRRVKKLSRNTSSVLSS